MHETNNGLMIQPMRDALQLIDMLPPSRESLSTDDVTHARSTSTGVGRSLWYSFTGPNSRPWLIFGQINDGEVQLMCAGFYLLCIFSVLMKRHGGLSKDYFFDSLSI